MFARRAVGDDFFVVVDAAGALGLLELFGVVDDQIVALALHGKIAVDDLGLEEAFVKSALCSALKTGSAVSSMRRSYCSSLSAPFLRPHWPRKRALVLMKGKSRRGERCSFTTRRPQNGGTGTGLSCDIFGIFAASAIDGFYGVGAQFLRCLARSFALRRSCRLRRRRFYP